eukprot:CAMPEP_0194141748 /NCGR_PEP_ID=MMETSP0152-20130528/11130_1 /TAXON_ID=1049557 /ORGANISM="Thalassiothrix antarctica, Strain L6-D1" /LENGTH=498 /DNA_ID=CAMNT_0038840477 /DNA_START=1 /DNA_END=1497 /DNA_ORIENTATION=+
MREMANSEEGVALVMDCVLFIICNLRTLQAEHHDDFYHDIESSCAAGNDFMRMIDYFDQFIESVLNKYPALKKRKDKKKTTTVLEKESSELVAMYGNDAIFTVQRSQVYVMKIIHDSTIRDDIFSVEWEESFTCNEVALSIVQTMEDYLYDFHNFLSDEYLYQKIVAALVRAVVCFYIRSLLQKAENVRRRRRRNNRTLETRFNSPTRAILRLMYDIQVFHSYFTNLVKQIPPLRDVVREELGALSIIYECINLAINDKDPTTGMLQDHILVLHKRTGASTNVTKYILQDLWLLVSSKSDRKKLNETFLQVHVELERMSTNIKENDMLNSVPKSRDLLPGLLLKEVLAEFYELRIAQEKVVIPCAPCLRLSRDKARLHNNKGSATPKSPTSIVNALNLDFMKPKMNPRKLDFDKENTSHLLPILCGEDKLLSKPAIFLGSLSEVNMEEHKKIMETLEGKLFKILKLHNLNFINHTVRLRPRMKNKDSLSEDRFDNVHL